MFGDRDGGSYTVITVARRYFVAIMQGRPLPSYEPPRHMPGTVALKKTYLGRRTHSCITGVFKFVRYPAIQDPG